MESSLISDTKEFPVSMQQQVIILAEENALLNTPDKNVFDQDMKIVLDEIKVLKEFKLKAQPKLAFKVEVIMWAKEDGSKT